MVVYHGICSICIDVALLSKSEMRRDFREFAWCRPDAFQSHDVDTMAASLSSTTAFVPPLLGSLKRLNGSD